MIGKDKAERMIREEIDAENLRKHMYAVSAIMRGLAEKLGEDPELWERVGLLHDIDYEETKNNPEEHGKRSAELLEGRLPEEALEAIRAHNFEHLNVKPEKDLENALIAADAISGLIVATALVMPNGKLEEARVESVLKKFNDPSFAKNIERDRILYCEELGLSEEEFAGISFEALQNIHSKLGL